MKKNFYLAIAIGVIFILSGCGSDELTIEEAEKAIRSDEPWVKSHEFNIVVGDLIPKTVSFNREKLLKKSYLPLYSFLQESQYLTFDKIYGHKKHGPSGERYLTDIYKIIASEKLKSLAHETLQETCEYGVYPPGEDVWQNKEAKFAVYKIDLKLIDYHFMKINSINDLRQESSSSSDCDVIVNFSYQKQFTELGKIVGEYPGGRSFGTNPKTDSVIESNACFQRVGESWKVEKNLTSI